ncbi:MAG: Holliday junction resolvase RuvX [Candidatus Atribacteria bacterium]|nr:Holliday junction resolvase RuvX [Candidatus Atribacteria bacterium]MCK4309575.1 Holliday junction resolvase RuvX [Candidatus Atribacteria bacterium]
MLKDEIIVAIDPGTRKCGYAVVDSNLSVLQREVTPTDKIINNIEDSSKIYKINKIILGDGTNYKQIEKKLKNYFPRLKIILIEEDFSTLEARKKYFEAHPPRGISKLIPLSLRVPPCQYDDFVAVLLAEKYFKN